MTDFDSLFRQEYSITMKTVETVLPPLPPDLLAEGGRAHLRETSSLLLVPEGRSLSLNLRALLSLAYDNHHRQILHCLRDVSECLRIDQDMGF